MSTLSKNVEQESVGRQVLWRLGAHGLLIALLLFAPWWATYLVAAALMGLLPWFVEAIGYGIMVDLLFASSDPAVATIYTTTLLFTLTFVIVECVKLQVR